MEILEIATGIKNTVIIREADSDDFRLLTKNLESIQKYNNRI